MTAPPRLRERLTEVFREVFDDETLELSDATTARDVDGWDSLQHITLILAVEREFSIRVTAAEAGLLANVGELLALVVAHGGR